MLLPLEGSLKDGGGHGNDVVVWTQEERGWLQQSPLLLDLSFPLLSESESGPFSGDDEEGDSGDDSEELMLFFS